MVKKVDNKLPRYDKCTDNKFGHGGAQIIFFLS